jgi:hypothetical protein
MGRLGRNKRSNSVGESPNLLLTMEGQTRRQIGKGSKLKFTLFFFCDGISLCGIVAQRMGKLDAVNMEDGVGDMAYINVMRLLDDRDGIQSSWASISVRMLFGLAALWGQKLGIRGTLTMRTD